MTSSGISNEPDISMLAAVQASSVTDVEHPAIFRHSLRQLWQRMSGTFPPEPHARSLKPIRSRGNLPTSSFLRSGFFGLARHNPSRSADDKLNAIKGPGAWNLWTNTALQKQYGRS